MTEHFFKIEETALITYLKSADAFIAEDLVTGNTKLFPRSLFFGTLYKYDLGFFSVFERGFGKKYFILSAEAKEKMDDLIEWNRIDY